MGIKLNALDKLFLQLETPTTPMHVGGLLVFEEPQNGAGDANARFDKLRQARVCADPFNWQLHSPKGRAPSWRPVSDVDVRAHVKRSLLSSSGDDDQLMKTVSELHSTPIDQSRPMWECHVVDGLDDGRYGVYYKIHHACIDGVSGIKRMQSALSDTPDADTVPLWAEKRKQPRAPKRNRLSRRARLARTATSLTSQASAVPEIGRALFNMARQARRDPSNLTSMPYSAPKSSLNQMVSDRRSFAFQRLPLSGVREIGKAAGATVNEVALALCSSVLRDLLLSRGELPDKPLIAMLPVSLRSEGEGPAGNRVSSVLCNLGTHIADPVERLETIAASSRHSKDMIRKMSKDAAAAYSLVVAFPAIAMQLLGKASLAPLPFNVVVSNVPGPRTPLYERGARLEAIYPVSLLFERQAINFTLISYLDTLDFGLIACRKAVPDLRSVAGNLQTAYETLRQAVLGHN